MRDFAIAATVCLAATFPFAAPAHAFTAQNGLVVEPDANGFAVPWRGMAGPADFWCAAGDYAIRALHMNPTEVVYRARLPGAVLANPCALPLIRRNPRKRRGFSSWGRRAVASPPGMPSRCARTGCSASDAARGWGWRGRETFLANGLRPLCGLNPACRKCAVCLCPVATAADRSQAGRMLSSALPRLMDSIRHFAYLHWPWSGIRKSTPPGFFARCRC